MANQNTPAAAAPEVMSKAERAATVEAEIDLKSTMLIGFVGKTDDPEALLRNRDGSIIRVARGDKTRLGTVIGIDGEALHLKKGGTVSILRLPKT